MAPHACVVCDTLHDTPCSVCPGCHELLAAPPIVLQDRLGVLLKSAPRRHWHKEVSAMRCHGNVKWFDDKKGYGFIDNPDGDVFVHYSLIQREGYRTLAEGEEVDYELARGEKGLYAIDVRPILRPVPANPTEGN